MTPTDVTPAGTLYEAQPTLVKTVAKREVDAQT